MNKVQMALQKLGIPTGPVQWADWARNARAADAGTLSRGRKAHQVRIVELTAEQARPVWRALPTAVPAGVGFYKRAGLVQQGTPEEFEALARRCAIFRLEPSPQDGPGKR